MNFLLDLNIKQETINNLIKKYDEGVITNFKIECDNVEEVINYFREIGIIDIDNLLILDISIFTKTLDHIKEIFNKNGLNETVKLINQDITYIMNL